MNGMDIGAAYELFNPGAKHLQDERQRLEHTWMVEGEPGQGCGPIDLESGTVLVTGTSVEAVLPVRPRPEETAEGEEDLPEV
jgi:hypothetical protein